ncbi:MAG: type II secretion system GspH family protein [Desulfobacterales bacterium]|nr:type II secretion system GspH family protein [Desulfobacterales bacterium]
MGSKIDGKRGFTLLEFIVVLLVGGIMTAMVFPYFGKTMSESSTPIFQVQNTFGLAGVLENVTAEYNSSDKSSTALASLQNKINNGSFNQGDFSVTAEFITVDSSNGNEPLTLKVTAADQVSNEQLWVLFTEQ